MSLRRVLITGGCGFIGVNLVRFLLQKDGYDIRVLDNLSAGKKKNLKKAIVGMKPAPVDLIVGDVRDQAVVERAVAGADWVVHLAAQTSVVDSLKNPREDFDINARGTLNLLEACRREGVRAFIFASSNAVLGGQAPPINEEMLPQPLSPYGAAKLAGEGLCFSYASSLGLKTIALRFANAYGPYCEHKTSVIARFIRWAQRDKPLIMYGDGNQTRDFIEVDDLCRAMYLSLQALETDSKIGGEVFQIATEQETSVNDLAEMIKEVTRRDLVVVHRRARRGESIRNFADISKAKRLLGFEPEVELLQGLKELWEWLNNGP